MVDIHPLTAPRPSITVRQSAASSPLTPIMSRDSDPLTTPTGEPVIKRHPSGRPMQTAPNPKRTKNQRNKQPRILDAYEAMQARAAGRLYDDDDISPFTSEDDE